MNRMQVSQGAYRMSLQTIHTSVTQTNETFGSEENEPWHVKKSVAFFFILSFWINKKKKKLKT